MPLVLLPGDRRHGIEFHLQPGLNPGQNTLQTMVPVQPQQHQSSEDTGFLHIRRVCEAATRESWIGVRAWGAIREPNLPRLLELACGSEATLTVAADEYVIVATELGIFGGRRMTQLEDLLRLHGTHVTITKGQTSQLSLRALSIDEIIRMALRSLREGYSSRSAVMGSTRVARQAGR
jgi:hypothetical protein